MCTWQQDVLFLAGQESRYAVFLFLTSPRLTAFYRLWLLVLPNSNNINHVLKSFFLLNIHFNRLEPWRSTWPSSWSGRTWKVRTTKTQGKYWLKLQFCSVKKTSLWLLRRADKGFALPPNGHVWIMNYESKKMC